MMTKEEKQCIAIEIDKYFRMRLIDYNWFSSHIKFDIERPDDSFKPKSMSKIKINQESIKHLEDNLYRFFGSATVFFEDIASKLGSHADVKFSGQAILTTLSDRTFVKDVVLTSFYRTTDIITEV